MTASQPPASPPAGKAQRRRRPPRLQVVRDDPAARQIEHEVHPVYWKQLRGWLIDAGWDPDPQLSPDEQFLGYALRLRHVQLGITLSHRNHVTNLVVSAVLCRGMERPELGLPAADAANRELRFGQVMFFPGPPPELHFYANFPYELIDGPVVARLLRQIVRELEETGFAAVSTVHGVHPHDLWQLLDELGRLEGELDRPPDRDDEAPEEAANGAAKGEPSAVEPPADEPTPQDEASRRGRRKKSRGGS